MSMLVILKTVHMTAAPTVAPGIFKHALEVHNWELRDPGASESGTQDANAN